MFPNFWQGECSGGARRRAWKRSGLRRTLNATVSKVDNLVWLPSARKRENWSRGPTVDDFCAGTHGCRPKSRGPTVDPGLTFDPAHQEKTCEDITPYGGKPQFPKNGRLFTPKYRFITPSTFDHTEKKLFTPSIFKITPS